MSVIVVGLNYRAVPLDLLERLTFDAGDIPKALAAVRDSDHVNEAVILSTCNRVEVYAATTGFHGGLAALRRFLSEFHHVEPDEFADRLSTLYGDDAAAHLFGVASGIDSMVVGEPQILTQVRRAFAAAQGEGSVGPTLSALFRQAIRVGRRARAETDIARGAATLARAGARLAREFAGGVSGKTVLIVGAGKMSDLAAVTFVREGARVLVANRTASRAALLAERVVGVAVPIADLGAALVEADVVLSSTGSPEPVIGASMVARAMRGRSRPLLLLDLAVPRDVEPSAARVPGVTIRDLDDLRTLVAPDARQLEEVARVREIVVGEVPKFVRWQRAHALGPLLAALRERGEQVRGSELRRALAVLGDLPDRQRETVEALARSIVSKLLHDPISAVKDHAGTPEGDMLARALRMLYGLEGEG